MGAAIWFAVYHVLKGPFRILPTALYILLQFIFQVLGWTLVAAGLAGALFLLAAVIQAIGRAD